MKSNILVNKFSILKRLIINSDLTLILNESPIVCQKLNFGVWDAANALWVRCLWVWFLFLNKQNVKGKNNQSETFINNFIS